MLTIHVTRPSRIKVPTFTRQDMLKIGAAAIQTIKQRVTQGYGIDDKKMKPLSKSYEKRKEKLQNRTPQRDMLLHGSMLGNMDVVRVQDKEVVIGFNSGAERLKASVNQDRSPWFGISAKNEEIIQTFARRLLKSK